MDKTDLANCFTKGNLYFPDINDANVTKPWNAHPKFNGVYLKHIITGDQTEGTFSAHLVKIDMDCSIGEHIHEGKSELHEIIEGSGICIIGKRSVEYMPGDCAYIPHDLPHKVVAGKQGLFLLAKFFPALS